MPTKVKFETVAVNAGAEPDPVTGAIAPPIHVSTTFEHGPANEETHGYIYVRDKNPTQDRLEKALSMLEGGEEALVFASGMGACAALLQALGPNSHIIFPEDVYVHVREIRHEYLPKWGQSAAVVNMRSLKMVERAIHPNTKLLWIETPSNPRLDIIDIAAVSRIAHAANALVLVDNTVATPVFQRPLDLGADLVLHSTTKYCGGHSDAQGGCLVFKKRNGLHAKVLQDRTILGAVCAPFNSWLVLRGLRTLPCRMERHAANALLVANALEHSGKVEDVLYPGLPSHPEHDIAARQMSGFGGMLSILVKGGWNEAVAAASKVKLFRNATSFGGAESLIEHRASAEGAASVSPRNLLRLAIGLEHPDDLIEDLLQALRG
jgi:cystathionine gamma-synthase